MSSTAPQSLQLLAHDLRWRLLSQLAKSDYRVNEMVEFTGRPVNLISYHLGKLRQAGLVSERRSSADGRDIYYTLELEQTRALLYEAGLRLDPSFWQQGDAPIAQHSSGEGAPVRVLFLCTRNSARSQMAEGLMRRMGGPGVDVLSAGDYPGSVHPLAVKALAELGIDISTQRAKHKDLFDGQAFDYVITVCDVARENCPTYASEPVQIHWSIPDPVADDGADDFPAFVSAAQNLRQRIRHLLARINADIHAPRQDAASRHEQTEEVSF